MRSRRDFARECFCFDWEAVNGSGSRIGEESSFAARKFLAEPPLARSRIPPATQAREGQTCFMRNQGRITVYFGKEKITPCRLVDSYLLTNT